MVDILLMTSKKEVEEILNPTKPMRSLDSIINDLIDIRDKGHLAVNIDDAIKLEILGIELIRHARETLAATV